MKRKKITAEWMFEEWLKSNIKSVHWMDSILSNNKEHWDNQAIRNTEIAVKMYTLFWEIEAGIQEELGELEGGRS